MGSVSDFEVQAETPVSAPDLQATPLLTSTTVLPTLLSAESDRFKTLSPSRLDSQSQCAQQVLDDLREQQAELSGSSNGSKSSLLHTTAYKQLWRQWMTWRRHLRIRASGQDSELHSVAKRLSPRAKVSRRQASAVPANGLYSLQTHVLSSMVMASVIAAALTLCLFSNGQFNAREVTVEALISIWIAGIVAVFVFMAFLWGPLQQIREVVVLFQEMVDASLHFSPRLTVRTLSSTTSSEVWSLRVVADKLSHAIRKFQKFLPCELVGDILQGNAKDNHVSWKSVTAMFVDLESYTRMAEGLHPEQLLRVLEKYFSASFPVITHFEGTVAEILGDGILAYWNTPGDVDAHAAKACAAAIALQESLVFLNKDLIAEGLPALSSRIGLHTGNVLTGNIGTQEKQKFGCLGDTVNLASRLEGLCKVYGVPIICSSCTVDALPADAGFTVMKLDRVQVKGRASALDIYEIMCPEMAWAVPGRLGQAVPAEAEMNAALSSALLSAMVLTSWGPPDQRHPQNDVARGQRWIFPAEPSSTLRVDLGLEARIIPRICEQKDKYKAAYGKALEAFQAGDFAQAIAALEELLARNPQAGQSTAVHQLLQRAQHHVSRPLTDHEKRLWSGVNVRADK
eukprot:TRINITY_DN30166_c0_g3_i2.p1 TRINITY_DN30166_c0_g3~~TRINITY_DN30166_c0_g3_i2.p1  ORF type:complete len:626 (-),score=111.13 TRINITY_DN30166_c0_g3_i2:80-1957(-)